MCFFREEQANLIKNVVLVAGKKKMYFTISCTTPVCFLNTFFYLLTMKGIGIDVLFSQSAAPSDSAAVEGPGPSVKQ